MAKLTAASRDKLKAKSFAGPDRSYPIPDANHARNALSRVAQNGSPALQKKVRTAVAKKFPSIGQRGQDHTILHGGMRRGGSLGGMN